MTRCSRFLAVFLSICLTVGTNGSTFRRVSGKFSEWTSWSKCSERVCCRHGVTSRRRHCVTPPCTGIETESEGCPKERCKKCISGPLATTTEAATGSFINTECETDWKHWASGRLSHLIRPSMYKTFPALKKILRSGFFSKQTVYIPRSRTKKMAMNKFCFEPTIALTSSQARRIFRTNRKTRVSGRKSNSEEKTVNGIVITTFLNGNVFKPGVFWTAIDRDGETAHFHYFHINNKPTKPNKRTFFIRNR